MFHIDRGVEYRATEIQRVHKRYGFIASMNRPGRCSDNAEMESFFHTLKGGARDRRDVLEHPLSSRCYSRVHSAVLQSSSITLRLLIL